MTSLPPTCGQRVQLYPWVIARPFLRSSTAEWRASRASLMAAATASSGPTSAVVDSTARKLASLFCAAILQVEPCPSAVVTARELGQQNLVSSTPELRFVQGPVLREIRMRVPQAAAQPWGALPSASLALCARSALWHAASAPICSCPCATQEV